MQIYFIEHKKLLASAGIELGSPLAAILQSEHSTTELAGPSNYSLYYLSSNLVQICLFRLFGLTFVCH